MLVFCFIFCCIIYGCAIVYTLLNVLKMCQKCVRERYNINVYRMCNNCVDKYHMILQTMLMKQWSKPQNDTPISMMMMSWWIVDMTNIRWSQWKKILRIPLLLSNIDIRAVDIDDSRLRQRCLAIGIRKKKEVLRTSTCFGSALKKDLFISIFFDASFDFFFSGSCSFLNCYTAIHYHGSGLGVIPALGRRWWRRLKDGFRIHFVAIDLEGIHLKGGLEVESTVCCTEGE